MATLDRIGLSQIESFLFRSQRHVDPRLGSVVETVSSTPLMISRRQADVALWRRFTHDLELASDQTVSERFACVCVALRRAERKVIDAFVLCTEHTTHCWGIHQVASINVLVWWRAL